MNTLSVLLGLTITFIGTLNDQVATTAQRISQGPKAGGISFETLEKQSSNFNNNIGKFQTTENRISVIGTTAEKKNMIAWQAQNTLIILHKSVLPLIDSFLAHKRNYGSNVEKNLYAAMDRDSFIDRLLKNRPLMFMGPEDQYILRESKVDGNGGFETIGKKNERAPLILANYLSYDEMQLAAIVGVSTPTFFINNGNRFNKGIASKLSDYEPYGIYTGLVGARFERLDTMESQHMIIENPQFIPSEAYKPHPDLLSIWMRFYGEKAPIPFEQAQRDTTGRFIKITDNHLYLDTKIYKKRIQLVIEPFLEDANNRGKAVGKKVYCHVVGLGLGVWIISEEQKDLFLGAINELLTASRYENISDIDFSYIVDPQANEKIGNITIHYSRRNAADKLRGNDEEKLLVAMYAWDGNSYPGNEYWNKNLTGSGDPAAACCSTIIELQNPYINSDLKAATKIFKTAA